jgi:O-antigen ligase/tetratricopeptide (TPR) repeat protein
VRPFNDYLFDELQTQNTSVGRVFSRLCEWIVLVLLTLVVFLSPFAAGSTDPWACLLIERVLSVAAIALAAGLIARGRDAPGVPSALVWCLVPLGLFVAFVWIQQMPISPSVLRMVSPATYELYLKTLPGWPTAAPYQDVLAKGGIRLPDQPAIWRTISIAPQLTRIALMKLAAYALVLAIVCLLPSRNRGSDERGLITWIMRIALVSGFVLAIIGFFDRLANAPSQGSDYRMTGAFLNADHFANYMAMIVPIAFTGALFPEAFSTRKWTGYFRLACGVTTIVLFIAVAMTLSRGGWIDLLVGVGIVIWMSAPLLAESGVLSKYRLGRRPALVAGCSFAAMFILGFMFLSSTGRSEVAQRLNFSFEHTDDWYSRVAVWQDSLPMVRDFAPVGVGLGGWPDLFPRYQRPPWDEDIFWRETHNDYLELLIEVGIAGFVLLGWFIRRLVISLSRGYRLSSASVRPLYIGLFGAIAAMAAHEFVDFSFQVPANAILFVTLLGAAMRLTFSYAPRPERPSRIALGIGSTATAGCGAALFLFSANQPLINYPYNLYRVEEKIYNAEEAEALPLAVSLVLAHPARSAGHLDVFGASPRLDSAFEINASRWLAPSNPLANDFYLDALEHEGRKEDALIAMSNSLMLSPDLDTHGFLREGYAQRLNDDEKRAVERGLKQAVDRGFGGAVDDLVTFYTDQKQFINAANVLVTASSQANDPDFESASLNQAASLYYQAGRGDKVRECVSRLIDIDPADPTKYASLLPLAFGTPDQLDNAKALVKKAVDEGAEPYPLYMGLAETYRRARELGDAELWYQKAQVERPYDFEANFDLGNCYIDERKFSGATTYLRRATELDPTSSRAYWALGSAEEGDFQYAAADKDYGKAVKLAPDNKGFSAQYADFKQRLAQSARAAFIK